MEIQYHKEDLPSHIKWGDVVAVDTEAMGLNPQRDRLCLVQLSFGDGVCHLVHFPLGSSYQAPHLKSLLANHDILKVFHFARFDYAILKHYLNVDSSPLYCTKIASRLVRTYTDRHGLKDLCKQLLNIDLSKQEQTSDWGADTLTDKQCEYAASDVLYLHDLKLVLDKLLKREQRTDLANKCFRFIPTRCDLDLKGWNEVDIFQH